MRAKTVFAIAVSCLVAGSASATIIQFDLSPLSSSALSTVNYANGDHTLGIAALNAVGQPASPATGGEILLGVFFDTDTSTLNYNLGYGSDHGFVDLVGNWTTAHIHGPKAVDFPAPNTGAGVIAGLPHAAGSSTMTGSFAGSVVLNPTQTTQLFDNLYYVNIHSSFAPGGEIRGQLVAVPEPATLGLALIGGLVLLRRRFRR